MKKKKQHHEEHADETWLLPYSDMLTLLLALFIVMFAMSQVDKAKLKSISKQFNIAFAGGSGVLTADGNSAVVLNDSATQEKVEQDKMTEIKYTLEQDIKSSGYEDNMKVELNDEGLNISIQDTVLFNSGDAEILNKFSPILGQISDMVEGLDNDIRVCGHTDNIPISNSKFRSNWDLSYMRALNVMNFMVNNGHVAPNKFSIQSYGEYKPKYDNSTEGGRIKNRRVEILIVRKYPVEHQKENK